MEQQWTTPQSNVVCNDAQTLIKEDDAAASTNLFDSLLSKGIVAAKSGDRVLARKLLNQVTEQEPSNEMAWMWLASLSEQLQERMAFIQKVLEINPNNKRALEWSNTIKAQSVNLMLQRGITAAKNNDHALATHLLLQVTDQEAENETAWLWLASAAESVEDQLAYLQRALTINPNNPRTNELYKSAKRNLARRLLQRGVAEATAGNRKLASEILEDVLEYDPNLEDAWFLKAYIADSLEEKIVFFEKCLSINSGHQHALAGLEAARKKLKETRISFECPFCFSKAEKELDECPECGAYLTLEDIDSLLNSNCANQKFLKTTIERLQDKYCLDKKDYYLLGLAYLNLNNIKQGVKFLQSSLEQDSGDEALSTRISYLLQRQSEIEMAALLKEQQEHKARKVIMVVDDSPTVCKLVTIKLEKHGYRVITAVDGMDALEKMKDETPDLMLLDINMPKLDGYQLCKLVKGNPATQHIPVVMLSGKDGFFDKLRGRMAGSVAYLTKPFQPNALLEVIAEYCVNKAG